MLPAEFSADLIGQWVGQHIWPLFRLASFLMVIPVFGTQLVPARVRLGLALLMTILIVPMIPPVPQVEALSADAVVITLQQILIGIGLGFALTARGLEGGVGTRLPTWMPLHGREFNMTGTFPSPMSHCSHTPPCSPRGTRARSPGPTT